MIYCKGAQNHNHRGRGRGGSFSQQNSGATLQRGGGTPRGTSTPRGGGTPRGAGTPMGRGRGHNSDSNERFQSPRGRGAGPGKSKFRPDAPLSKLLYEERPLLKPIIFVPSVYTRTLFENEEELLQPQVEKIGEYICDVDFCGGSKMKMQQMTKRAMYPLQSALPVYSVMGISLVSKARHQTMIQNKATN